MGEGGGGSSADQQLLTVHISQNMCWMGREGINKSDGCVYGGRGGGG